MSVVEFALILAQMDGGFALVRPKERSKTPIFICLGLRSLGNFEAHLMFYVIILLHFLASTTDTRIRNARSHFLRNIMP